MSNIELKTNEVNDTGALSEGVTSSRCPMDQQRRPGRHPATAEQRQKREGGRSRTTDGCLNVILGVNQRDEDIETEC